MKIEITQDISGTGEYCWTVYDGPEHIDNYTGKFYTLGECFEEIVRWRTFNSLHYYYEATEND